MKYTSSMETVQQNGRFTLFSSEFHSNIYSILSVMNLFLYKIYFSDLQKIPFKPFYKMKEIKIIYR